MQNLCLRTECTVSGYRSWSIHSTPLDPNWCLGVFKSISLTFDRKQDAKLLFRAWMHYLGVTKLWNISIGPKMMFGSVTEYFTNLWQVKRCKNCVSRLNALFWGTEVVKPPFYSAGPKMMFRSVSEHFTNLRQVKRCKTYVSGLNALFRGTEVVKRPFYSIGPKLMFGSVSEQFTNLRQVTRCKTWVPSLNALFRGYKVVKHLHWTQSDVWECYGVFH
jgi:hypothetical protein